VRQLFRLAIDSITSFSLLPLRITGLLGLTVTLFTSLLLVFILFTDFLHLQVYTAKAYFLVINTLLTGVTLSALGLMSLYIGAIHTEVVGRPLYLVSDRTHSPAPSLPTAEPPARTLDAP